jgi:hypothetical protein
MKIARTEHCEFKKLNTNGRCIAPCKHANAIEETDCIGNDGKTLATEGGREVHLGLGLRLITRR